MATPTQCVFDLDTPRRPGIDDVGGAAKEDDARFPPDSRTMATAADLNQWQQLLVRYAAVLPAALVSVTAGTSPSVSSVSTIKGSVVTPSTFTVTRNAIGDYSISWPGNTFPARTVDHDASVIGTGCMIGTLSGATSARVYLKNADGDGVDMNFLLRIYGD